MFWIIAILYSYVHGLECPKFECRQLRSNLCAEIDYNLISVNSDGCQSDSTCSFYELGAWVNEKQPLSGEFECTKYSDYIDPYYNSTYPGAEPQDNNTSVSEIPQPRYNYTEYTEIYQSKPNFLPPENYTETSEIYPFYNSSYGEENFNYSYIPREPYSNSSEEEVYIPKEYFIPCQYQELRNLAEGKHPKLCESDEDCKLQDGALATCKCGWDGNMYCVPDKYDDLWEPFWISCKKDGKMYYWDEYAWINYIDTFIWSSSMTIEDELCANLVFFDFKTDVGIMDTSTFRPGDNSSSGETRGGEDGEIDDKDQEEEIRLSASEDATSIQFIALSLAIFML
jgi:hypothetical protein